MTLATLSEFFLQRFSQKNKIVDPLELFHSRLQKKKKKKKI